MQISSKSSPKRLNFRNVKFFLTGETTTFHCNIKIIDQFLVDIDVIVCLSILIADRFWFVAAKVFECRTHSLQSANLHLLPHFQSVNLSGKKKDPWLHFWNPGLAARTECPAVLSNPLAVTVLSDIWEWLCIFWISILWGNNNPTTNLFFRVRQKFYVLPGSYYLVTKSDGLRAHGSNDCLILTYLYHAHLNCLDVFLMPRYRVIRFDPEFLKL